MKRRLGASIVFLFMLLSLCSVVSAVGVTTHYWDEKPLQLYPGQVAETDVVLQNMVPGSEDVTLFAEITEGSDIATLIDSSNEYLVPFGRKDIKVGILISVPANYQLGDVREVVISFKESAGEGEEMVQMATSVAATIPVLIVTENQALGIEETSSNTWILVIGILILIGVILLLIKHFASKPKKK